MEKILKKYSLKDAIKFEQEDRQFLALEKLYKAKKFSDENYLFLIIVNALICYQLSGKGEDYWEEFSTSPLIPLLIGEGNVDFKKVYNFFEDLLKNGKNNRRFVDMKLKRVEKICKSQFSTLLIGKGISSWEYYYKNMDILARDLAKIMNQKPDAKTIVFAIKMFSYGARNVFGYLEYFPKNIMIPIDSRLQNLYKKYVGEATKKEIKNYYIDLAEKLNIPLLHLDAILWVNYDNLIKTKT